jgi:hypothetical protein
MIRLIRILAVLAGAASLAASGPLLAQAQKAQGYLHEVSGNVTAQVGGGQPQKASTGEGLLSNTTLVTGPQSYAVLKFEDGTVVVLKENTSFQIQDYRFSAKAPEQSSALFNMVRGGLRMITGLVTSKNRDALKVATPMATISMRGTEFLAELTNPLVVQTISGVVGLTNTAGTVLVSAGQIASVANSTTLASVGAAGSIASPNIAQVTMPPTTPGLVPAGPAAGAAGGAIGVVGVAVGAAAVAGVAAAGGGGGGTTTHHGN